VGGKPNIKSFSSVWTTRIDDLLQLAYDKELDAMEQFRRALNG
jgi:hypothetical protein